MRRTFVIDGKQVEIDVTSLRSTSRLLEVTPVGGAWIERVATGQAKVHLIGLLPDGGKIDSTFTIVGKEKDGKLILASEPYPPIVG